MRHAGIAIVLVLILFLPVSSFAVIYSTHPGPGNPGISGGPAKDYLASKAKNGTLAINKTSVITIGIDKPVYNMTDIVHIYGKVTNLHSGVVVAMKVTSPLNAIQEVRQIVPLSDGSFQTIVTLSGPQWKLPGKYIIIANYGTAKDIMAFEYTAIPKIPEFGPVAAIVLVSAITVTVLVTRKFSLK